MLRILVIVGIFVGLSVSIPLLYQSNPQLFERVLSSSGAGENIPAADMSKVAANPAPPQGRKVLLKADARGHYAAQFKLNGRQIDALVDTGATVVALNMSTARRIGISLNPSDFRQEVSTANGKIKAASIMIDSLQIGRISVDKVQAVVLEDKALQINLIGMSFLNRLNKFQAQEGTLLLVQ